MKTPAKPKRNPLADKAATEDACLVGPWQTKLDSRGRITIPRPLRDRFGLRAGDTCTFTQLDDITFSVRFFPMIL